MPTGIVDSTFAEYAEYFELLCVLVDLDIQNPSVDYEEFIGKTMDRIMIHPYFEKRTSYKADKVLTGLLSLAEKIFSRFDQFKEKAYSNNFTQNSFEQLLFP